VTFCSRCGYHLTLGTEKFCPECGYKLELGEKEVTAKSFNISNTSGDVLGTGLSGSANLTGKDVGYTLKQNMMNIRVNTLSNDVMESLQKMTTIPTQVVPESSAQITNQQDKKYIDKQIENFSETQKQIQSLLEEVDNIEKASGEKIEEVNAGNLRISKDDLLLKEIILKGNEHYYNRQYDKANYWYDEAIKKDPNNGDVWFNKGFTLIKLGKYKKAVSCFDIYLKIDPLNAYALNNKAYSLAKTNRDMEALYVIDQALNINPHNAAMLDTKGFVLYKLGKYEEALDSINKSLKREENYIRLRHKADALEKLGRRTEAKECYAKSEELRNTSK